MKYLRLTICTICLTIMMMITSSYKVNAFTGNGGVEFPDKPDDGYSDFIIYGDLKNDKIFLISFNNTSSTYVTTSYWYSSGGTYLDIFSVPICNDPKLEYKNVCSSSLNNRITDYKKYVYSLKDGSIFWNDVTVPGAESNFYSLSIIYASTVDIYYRKDAAESTYPEYYPNTDRLTYLIPGTYEVNKNLRGLDSSYAIKTYNRNYLLYYRVNEVTRTIEDNTFSYDTYTIDFDFTSVIEEDYKIQLDFGSFSNKYTLPVTIENPKITIANPYYADVNINVFNKNGDLVFSSSIGKENFPNNDLKYLFIEGKMTYNEEIKKDSIIFTFDYRRLVDINNIYLIPNVDPNTINQDFKFNSSYLINDKVIDEPYYILEINEDNFSEYPNLHIVVNFKDVESYSQTIGISDTFGDFDELYDSVYEDYVNKLSKVHDNESFFQGLSRAFDRFKNNLSIILGDLNYFFNSLSTDYKYYFYVIFGLTLFGIVIRFIL